MPLGLYHAWVRGIAADGTPGGWSATRILSVMPAPTVTQGINSTFDRTPTFAWNALLGAAEYEVFVRNRNTSVTTWYQQHIAALSFTPATALADGPYRVWVVGVSSSGVQSLWTAPIDISIGGQTNQLTPHGILTILSVRITPKAFVLDIRARQSAPPIVSSLLLRILDNCFQRPMTPSLSHGRVVALNNCNGPRASP